MFAPFGFYFHHKALSLEATLEICGIVTTLIGTLWLGAGVYISQQEIAHIANLKPKKAIGLLGKALKNASNKLWLGAIYLVVGAAFLIVSVVAKTLEWT